jgi:hypothetical protein
MRKRLGLDHLGIGLSALCAVHCLSIPVLFALLPSLHLALHSFNAPLRALAINLLYLQSYDRWLVVLALMVAAVSLAFGWRRHRSGVPLAWMLAAAAAFATGLLLSRSQVGWHLPILLLGSSLLITAHVWNLRLLRVASRSK